MSLGLTPQALAQPTCRIETMPTDAQIAKETYELFSFCREEGGHTAFLRDAEVAQRYYASQQMSAADINKRTNEGRLSFAVNEIFRTINAVRGELTNLSTDMRYDPKGGGAAEEVASVLNKLSAHVDRMNKSYMVDDIVRLHGLLLGRGYWELRVDFDDNLEGTIKRTWKRPQNVVLDADITSPDPNDWDRVFTTEVVSQNDIANMYGKRLAGDLAGWPLANFISAEDRTLAASLGMTMPMRDGGFDPSRKDLKQYRLISEQYREYKNKEFFIDLQSGDTREIPENWDDDRVAYVREQYGYGVVMRKAKTVRWRVVCNDRVLHDEDSPYKHFTIVPFMPYFLDGYAMSLFQALKGPQDMLNYTVNEELHILGTTSHSGWKIKAGSLKNMTSRQLEQKGAKNGLVLELDDPNDAERITPGQPASGFENLGNRSRQWISEIANVTPAMLGSQGQYAPGKGMDSQLSRAPVNLSAALTAYQFSMNLIAEVKLNLFQTYYTETRTFRIANSDLGTSEEVTINQPDAYGEIANNLMVGEYTVRMMPTTSRTAADEFAFEELLQLKEIGITVPNSLFVAASSIQGKQEFADVLRAANNGEVSPEEQRAQQLALELQEAEVEDVRAGIENKKAQSQLNLARAEKNFADSTFNPHQARSENERVRMQMDFETRNRQIDQQERKQNSDTALKLTEIATTNERDKEKVVASTRNNKQPRRGNKK